MLHNKPLFLDLPQAYYRDDDQNDEVAHNFGMLRLEWHRNWGQKSDYLHLKFP